MSQLIYALLFCFGAYIAVLVAFRLLKRRTALPIEVADHTLVFLLRDRRILDANFVGRRVLERMGGTKAAYEHLRLFLGRNFGEVDKLVAPASPGSDLMVQSRDGHTQVSRQIAGDTIRLTVSLIDDHEPGMGDIHTVRAAEAELETLRANTSSAPFLLWRQNADGEVTWVNQAYLDNAKSVFGKDVLNWPLPVVFPSLSALTPPKSSESRRVAVQGDCDGENAWFDCHITTVGEDILCTAIPADEAVQAENRRREFTQTLTKTFAELAIGLAIFDRSRRLVLFNPALLDLTSLPSDFLTSRPSLIGFLDRLRENRVMPEPRDYRSWRASIAELEAAAADGTYSETWYLPDGQTYHVTGRPHPDGAVALLFEDISAEMALTRHFRTELDLSQAVLDTLDEAVAVFSSSGDIVVANMAYRALWRFNDEDPIGVSLTEATRRWHELTAPTPIWGDFREFAQQSAEREEWAADVSMRNGQSLYCRFVPQKGGATMAMFRKSNITVQELQKAV